MSMIRIALMLFNSHIESFVDLGKSPAFIKSPISLGNTILIELDSIKNRKPILKINLYGEKYLNILLAFDKDFLFRYDFVFLLTECKGIYL